MALVRSHQARKTCLIVFAFTMVNFAVFVLIAIAIGGDAISGHAEAGRFFLASHGKLTETTKSIFFYSKVHTYSVWVTQPVGLLAGWVYWKQSA